MSKPISSVAVALALNLTAVAAVSMYFILGCENVALATVLLSTLHIVLCGTLLKFFFYDHDREA